jgi:Flp pilus assembly protein TadG
MAGDRGVLATVIVLPALLVAVWLVLQYAFALHVRHGAQVAAQDAALAGARSGGGDPAAVAESLMASLGGAADNVAVSVTRDADRVTVTVSADVIQIVPIGDYHVTESASAPIEVFIPEDERG